MQELTNVNQQLTDSENECLNWKLEEIEQSIIKSSISMAKSMLEIGKGLKAICDGKKYAEKGYESFKAYMEDAAAHTYPFSYSQARKHIRVYERYGNKLNSLNCAKIEVLDILRDIPEEEFEKISNDGTIENMTRKEAEELKKKLNAANEQLSLITDELKNEQSKTVKLERQLEEANNRPIETIVQEPSKEQIEKLKKEIEKKSSANLKKAEKEAAELKALNEQLGADKAAADDKIQALERQLQSAAKSSDTELIEFKFYFAQIQDNLKKFMNVLSNISDTDKKEKFKGAAINFVKAILSDLDDGGQSDA